MKKSDLMNAYKNAKYDFYNELQESVNSYNKYTCDGRTIKQLSKEDTEKLYQSFIKAFDTFNNNNINKLDKLNAFVSMDFKDIDLSLLCLNQGATNCICEMMLIKIIESEYKEKILLKNYDVVLNDLCENIDVDTCFYDAISLILEYI